MDNELGLEYQDIDITDKTILESQFNYTRNSYYNCIKKLNSINNEISKKKKLIYEIKKKLYQNPEINNKSIPAILAADDDYLEITYEIEAYEKAEKIVQEELTFLKSDLRILSNSMYTKF